jgi:release factor glutamine methyltransferase
MNDLELIEKYLPKEQWSQAKKRLLTGEPVQYIIGNVDFCGYPIIVNKDVLIPRFETEYLCSKLKKYLLKYFSKNISIADLGTGSGAISIYLKKELNCNINAFDISDNALNIAKQNAMNNNVEINFIKHDILTKIPGKYDCLVSNPPYIKKDGILEDKVFKYEPHIALYADDNGLKFYKSIIHYAKDVLNEKFIIAFEIGFDEANDIISLASKQFPNAKIILEKDLNNLDRYIFIINE